MEHLWKSVEKPAESKEKRVSMVLVVELLPTPKNFPRAQERRDLCRARQLAAAQARGSIPRALLGIGILTVTASIASVIEPPL